ncbi:MAG TPA: SRPBCC domain-containing protein [Yeosuana sp.]
MNASTTQIFDAVSLPKHLNNWWTLKCTGDLKLNADNILYFNDTYNWFGKVSSCIPNKSFHIKMTKADPDWDTTTFGFDLEEVDKGALLKFSHENWQELNHNFKHSSFC